MLNQKGDSCYPARGKLMWNEEGIKGKAEKYCAKSDDDDLKN